MKNKLAEFIDIYSSELKTIFGIGFVGLIIWLGFNFLTARNRQSKLAERKVELVGALLSHEVKETMSQTEGGGRVVPSSLTLVYEFNFKDQTYKKEEFILWEQLTIDERKLAQSDGFCIKIKTYEDTPANGKAIVVKCE